MRGVACEIFQNKTLHIAYADSLYRQCGELTPRICNREESIFDYLYILECEAKIKKAPGIILGTYAEPFYIKNPKIHLLVGSYDLKTELLLSNQQKQKYTFQKKRTNSLLSSLHDLSGTRGKGDSKIIKK
jgi:hypothetical protein